jgi:hypothetical protein
MWIPRYTSAKLPFPMWSILLNLPMICSGVAEDDGDAPDRRGAYGFDGVAMLTALAYQPDQSSLGARCMSSMVLNYQHRCGYRVAVRSLHMGWCRRRGASVEGGRGYDALLEVCWARCRGRDAAAANRLR